MKSRDSTMGTQLESLEKWRTSELDRAQVLHAEKRALAEKNEEMVDGVRQLINGAQELAREQMIGAGVISVDSLTRIRHFTALQTNELKEAQTVLENSQREVAEAQAVVLTKFENLTVLERLKKRRTAQALKADLRTEQKMLDDQALLKRPDPKLKST